MKSSLLAVVFTLMLGGSLCAGTNPVLATNKPQTVFGDVGSSQTPPCSPGDLCVGNQFELPQTDGAPIMSCDPGKNCARVDDQLKLQASDGAPIPSCDPGKNCTRVDDQLKLQASDGALILSYDPVKYYKGDYKAITIVV